MFSFLINKPRKIFVEANRYLVSSAAFRKVFRTIKIPADLGPITDIAHEQEIDPTQVGVPQADADAIWQAVEDLYSSGYYPAIMFCLRRNGKIIFNRAIGHSRGNGPTDSENVPLELAKVTTPGCIYSASKAITAIVIHKLAEQGKVDLLNPIAHYVPEFAVHGKDKISIFELLAHRGGVPDIEIDDVNEKLWDVVLDGDVFLERICATKPSNTLGRDQAYHAITGGAILQAIIERVTGMTIREYWDQNFKQPMNFDCFDYGLPEGVPNNIAQDYLTGMRSNYVMDKFIESAIGGKLEELVGGMLGDPRVYENPIPAANMVATAEELSRIFQMLLDKGEYQGEKILDPSTVTKMTYEVSPHRFDAKLILPLRYSPGFMLGGDPVGLYGIKTPNAFGHVGLINVFGWADPDRDISVGLITTGKPFVSHNLPFLANLLAEISMQIPRDCVTAQTD